MVDTQLGDPMGRALAAPSSLMHRGRLGDFCRRLVQEVVPGLIRIRNDPNHAGDPTTHMVGGGGPDCSVPGEDLRSRSCCFTE